MTLFRSGFIRSGDENGLNRNLLANTQQNRNRRLGSSESGKQKVRWRKVFMIFTLSHRGSENVFFYIFQMSTHLHDT